MQNVFFFFRFSNQRMESLGSMKITNKTPFPLEIQLSQVGPLYYDLVFPNGVFDRETGAVHFTINGRINTTGESDTMTKDILPILRASLLVSGSIAESGIAAGQASVGTCSSTLLIGAVLKVAQAVVETASTAVAMLPGKDKFSSAGWYAGYKHDLEIHYEDGIWKIKDVKYNRLYIY